MICNAAPPLNQGEIVALPWVGVFDDSAKPPWPAALVGHTTLVGHPGRRCRAYARFNHELTTCNSGLDLLPSPFKKFKT